MTTDPERLPDRSKLPEEFYEVRYAYEDSLISAQRCMHGDHLSKWSTTCTYERNWYDRST